MKTLSNITGFALALSFLFGIWAGKTVSAGMKEELDTITVAY